MALKKVGSVRLTSRDFLIVPDESKPSTWRMRIGLAGIVNRSALIRAYKALTTGWGGRVYEGPHKAKAMAKLKQAAKRLGINLRAEAAPKGVRPRELAEGAQIRAGGDPVEERFFTEEELLSAEPLVDDGLDKVAEYWDPEMPLVPWGVLDFDSLYAADQAQEAAKAVRVMAYQFGRLVDNVIGDQTVTDKVAAFKVLTSQFNRLAEETMGAAVDAVASGADAAGATMGGEAAGQAPAPAGDTTKLAETFEGHARIVESDGATGGSGLTLEVGIIRPGWGNPKDEHYYPADMLARDGKAFKGAKMYETDHRDAEKSTRTWVSTIQDIVGTAEDGSPIARVFVHDPGFAERVRNLSAAGMLDKMECSILAAGVAERGEVDGKPAKIVKQILEASSVDWVTRAGAGGRAMKIVESASGSGRQEEDVELTEEQKNALKAKVDAGDLAGARALMDEYEKPDDSDAEESAKTTAPAGTASQSPAALTSEAASKMVAASTLPAAAHARVLALREAWTETDLKAAIVAEVAYLKELTASGRPVTFQTDSGAGPVADRKQTDALIREVNRRALGL